MWTTTSKGNIREMQFLSIFFSQIILISILGGDGDWDTKPKVWIKKKKAPFQKLLLKLLFIEVSVCLSWRVYAKA